MHRGIAHRYTIITINKDLQNKARTKSNRGMIAAILREESQMSNGKAPKKVLEEQCEAHYSPYRSRVVR